MHCQKHIRTFGSDHVKAIYPLLLAALAAVALFPTPATAGLKSKATKLTDAALSGTMTACEPQTVSTTRSVRLPSKATGVRYSGPRTGDLLDLDYATNVQLSDWQAEVESVRTKRRGTKFESTITLTVIPPVPCTGRLPAPTVWSLELELGAKYGMRATDRFEGFMANYDGARQRSSYTGNYHSLEFRDRLGLRTRYKVCASGTSGSQCWRRSTNSEGFSSIQASLAINDRIGPGTLRWYVDGRLVAKFRYKLKGESV